MREERHRRQQREPEHDVDRGRDPPPLRQMGQAEGDEEERPPAEVVARLDPPEVVEPEQDADEQDAEAADEPPPRVVIAIPSLRHDAPGSLRRTRAGPSWRRAR